ncbi:MAG: hypothetical protein CML56_00895 [Rhodobacteraceae bacterium]|nr:hypothetical protein [Paracoccaceae bacterium]
MKITRRQLRSLIREAASTVNRDPQKGETFVWPDSPGADSGRDEYQKKVTLGKEWKVKKRTDSSKLGKTTMPMEWVFMTSVTDRFTDLDYYKPKDIPLLDWIESGAHRNPQNLEKYFVGDPKNVHRYFDGGEPAPGYRWDPKIQHGQRSDGSWYGEAIKDRRKGKKGLRRSDIQTNAGTKFSLADGPDSTFDVRGNLLDPKAVRKLAEALQKLRSGELTPGEGNIVGLDIG